VEAACPRCGVIVAKARARAAATAPPGQAPLIMAEETDTDPPGRMGPLTVSVLAALLVVAGAVGSRMWDRSRRATSEAAATATSEAPEAAAPAAPAFLDEPPPPAPFLPATPPVQDLEVETVEVPDADRRRANELVQKLANRTSLTAADVQSSEDLVSRNPDEPPLRDLLEAVLLAAAARHERQRQFPQAVAYLERARQVKPSSAGPLMRLLQVFMQTENWPAAEEAARALIGISPRSFEAWQRLGYALMRQDRNREALEALRAALDVRDDTNTRLLMERIEKGMADEKGMAERRLAHFSVRYDGGEHEAVGREILRALEHHYAALASALDYQPVNTISVILFTREGYYNASGAPAWSGGAYDNIDGRIRIPIGGLTSSLTPDMDETLVHELTHAFIADRTRGQAPRELHEGLAQYMEGKRIDSVLTSEQITALADRRIGGVAGYYFGALAFVEYLIATRGLGGMNELLKVMGESGSVDEAFRQVHGTSYRGAQQAWTQRFRQQRGGG
jgi:tetratricopeptide (TPR) repeat protein